MRISDVYGMRETGPDGKLFLLNLMNGKIYQVNDLGKEILQSIDRNDDMYQVEARIIEMFAHIEPGIIRKDIESFIAELQEMSIVVEQQAGGCDAGNH